MPCDEGSGYTRLHLIREMGKILDGEILVIAGESAKSAKIFPLQNFALYGKFVLKRNKVIPSIGMALVTKWIVKETDTMVMPYKSLI